MEQYQVPAFSEEDIAKDIAYFQNKLKFTFDALGRERIIKQLALLEDAPVIYHETRSGENI